MDWTGRFSTSLTNDTDLGQKSKLGRVILICQSSTYCSSGQGEYTGPQVAQPGSASALGAEGRRFKSCLPDHIKAFGDSTPEALSVDGTTLLRPLMAIEVLGIQ